MSKITTRSLFYYGTTVDTFSKYIDFNEGSGQITATLNHGDYSPTEYADEIERALNEVGGQTYTVTFNRTTRALTISAAGAFSLLTSTGTHSGSAIWDVAGFHTNADYSSATSHVGELKAGEEYQTQYPVDKYLSPDDSFVNEHATANQSVTGVTELIYFADNYRLEMNIRLITNRTDLYANGCSSEFYTNASGVSDFKNFIQSAIKLQKVEFMPDVDTPASFFTVILESTKEGKIGERFELKNMKTPDIYESGLLTFRGVIES